MKLKIIDDFYNPSDFGLIASHFVNTHFTATFQSKLHYYGNNRMNAYPCYETNQFYMNDEPYSIGNIFKKTFEEKTNLKIYYFTTYLRKIKLNEFKQSAAWGQHKPHQDNGNAGIDCDVAGLIYFNSESLKDGTNIYNSIYDYVPTTIIGSRANRCVFYDPYLAHQQGTEQEVEERWIQPFFAITNEEIFKKWCEKNAA